MSINIRKIFIITILVICVISINLAVFLGITKKDDKTQKFEEVIVDSALLTQNFEEIFDNKIDNQGNLIKISREDYSKELVYTNYSNQEKIENSYELDVNIPYININIDTVKKINKEIESVFYKKVKDILVETNEYTIYSVNYKAYVNDNILSLVIKSTLKEGNNAQRVIIKTYNYNISSNTILSINDILNYRNIEDGYAQKQINDSIKKASEEANNLNQLGYTKYLRNINDSIYKLENTNVCFLGENKALYIIYPYGNTNYTSEFDLIVI